MSACCECCVLSSRGLDVCLSVVSVVCCQVEIWMYICCECCVLSSRGLDVCCECCVLSGRGLDVCLL
jgi:hypothetical protein